MRFPGLTQCRGSSGQGLTESVLALPLFLMAAFAALQMGQIGISVLLTHYAASAVARKASSEQDFSRATKGSSVNIARYNQKVADLMVGGIEPDAGGIVGCVDSSDSRIPTGELSVAVRTRFSAWPFFGDMIHGALKDQFDAQPLACPGLVNTGGFGPFNFSASAPYYFYVTAKAKVRLNYVQ